MFELACGAQMPQLAGRKPYALRFAALGGFGDGRNLCKVHLLCSFLNDVRNVHAQALGQLFSAGF